jgi:hypothetical protein
VSRNWWFDSTAISLPAAAQDPIAVVLSIARLVDTCRVGLPNNPRLPEGIDDSGIDIREPCGKQACIAASTVHMTLMSDRELIQPALGSPRQLIGIIGGMGIYDPSVNPAKCSARTLTRNPYHLLLYDRYYNAHGPLGELSSGSLSAELKAL